MPVAQETQTPARLALSVGVAALLGLLAIVFLVTRVDNLTGGSTPTQISADVPVQSLGSAESIAEQIALTGPFLLPDPSDGNRDVYVQHLGADADQGWFAFAARPDDAPRRCFVEWQPNDETLVDNCDGTVFPADGTGLTQYPITLDGDGNLTLRFEAQR
jgi:hypothetical protein